MPPTRGNDKSSTQTHAKGRPEPCMAHGQCRRSPGWRRAAAASLTGTMCRGLQTRVSVPTVPSARSAPVPSPRTGPPPRSLPLKRITASWSGPCNGSNRIQDCDATFRAARRAPLGFVGYPNCPHEEPELQNQNEIDGAIGRSLTRQDLDATVLRRVKRHVLAMLASPVKNGRTCAWLRCRRESAALLTRLARRGRPEMSARGAPDTSTRTRRAASNKGHDLEVPSRHAKSILGRTHTSQLTDPIQGSGRSPFIRCKIAALR